MNGQDRTQALLDRFYRANGPCCAGCDWWRWHNSVAGECIRTVPVSGHDRCSMIGVQGTSFPVPTGHIMTNREHICGEFFDSEMPPKNDGG